MRKSLKVAWEDAKRMASDTLGVIGTVQVVVVAAIFILVGVYIFSAIYDAMPTPSNDALNTTINTTLITNTTAAFELLIVSIIVLAAAAIIGILIRSFMPGRGPGV